MKHLAIIILAALTFCSCETTHKTFGASPESSDKTAPDQLITESLFNDKSATISEENIQKILDGNYKLPQNLRVAIVKLESLQQRRYSYWWSDEEFLKTQQSYLDLFAEKFKQSARVKTVSIIPDLLISKTPSFTNLREAAVRMQADVVVIYGIAGDIYSKYKLFGKADIKAFATTQLIVLDVRTGLVPFSTIITKDILSQKRKEELDETEARNRVQKEAVLLTINEIGQKVTDFLNTK
jgi:hypothetical protein